MLCMSINCWLQLLTLLLSVVACFTRTPPVTTSTGSVSEYANSIVVTTIQHPTPSIVKLAGLPNWKVIVVGDLKTPADWFLENVDFLSHDKQRTLGYEILKNKLTPDNSYARKNVGYLWAISHGAQTIYETDDDNMLITDDIVVLPSPGYHPVYKSSNRTINVYSHFQQPTVWPRGFPLEDVSISAPHSFAYQNVRPLIQQSLANLDPDVDAIYRLTQPLGIAFDSSAFDVTIPKGSFCPFNSQNTLFLQDALWGMLIPVSTAFRVCDIWRGYWSQRLLWDIGGLLSFATATVEQHRNVHNILLDYFDETDLYEKAGKLVNFLVAWQSTAADVPQRMVELADAMAAANFWGTQDVALMKAWVTDLDAAGYKFPSVQSASVHHKPTHTNGNRLPAYLYPKMWQQHSDITLVVMFNSAYKGYEVVATLLHQIYKPAFGQVIFTGQDAPEGLPDDLTWVPCVDTSYGELMHKCLGHVIEAHPLPHSVVAGGYLMIGDDTVLDLCALPSLNTSKIWLENGRKWLAQAQLDIHTSHGWHWDRSLNGGKAVRLELYDAMMSLSGSARSAAEEQGLFKGNLTSKTAFYEVAFTDFVYIPKRFAAEFTYLAYHFAEHPVHHEVAIPNIMRLLAESLEELEDFHAPIRHLYHAGINVAEDPAAVMLAGGLLMNNSVFVHPVKLSNPVIKDHFISWWVQTSCPRSAVVVASM